MLDSAAYEANPSIRQTIHDALNDRSLGIQLLNHRAYELHRSTMTRVHPDGRKDIFAEPEPMHFLLTGNPADTS